MIIHVVKPGQTIYSISKLYNVPYQKIISDNEIINPTKLVVGQTIVIMDGSNIKLGTIDVNGYAIPPIDMNILKKTLPYLTYLSIFSYNVRPNGTLNSIDDEPLITAARNARVAPIMVITNITESGFSSELANTILNSEEIQNNLINNVIKILESKKYYGLDIDFEFIYPKDKENYNNFLKKISKTLKEQGYIVLTSLAPKTSSEQSGLLYEAHDYPIHGQLADYVILMTYEWGYISGPPMAVAPLNEVKKVLNYAITEIPRQKILMGVPNYGYDWTLPYVKGTKADTLSINEAIELAVNKGPVIKYDYISQAPFYNYYGSSGKEHIVWFEDARSIRAKLLLVNSYKLAGVSYWTINKYFAQNWLVLSSMYNINKVIK